MKIQITKFTVADLQEVENYIRHNNPAAAVRTVLRVLEAMGYLTTYPTIALVVYSVQESWL